MHNDRRSCTLLYKSNSAPSQEIGVDHSTLKVVGFSMQPSNVRNPILVTDFGIIMLVRLVQPENNKSSIMVTDSGIVMLVRLVQPENVKCTKMRLLFQK